MSPAARRERDMRKARRLMNVVVDEVSSVSSGAGRGVTVQYMKGNSMQTEPTTFQKALAVAKYARDEDEYAKRNFGSLANFHNDGPALWSLPSKLGIISRGRRKTLRNAIAS
jgi:hypothetical protein